MHEILRFGQKIRHRLIQNLSHLVSHSELFEICLIVLDSVDLIVELVDRIDDVREFQRTSLFNVNEIVHSKSTKLSSRNLIENDEQMIEQSEFVSDVFRLN
jgi:hypothetical protein